MTLSYEKYNDKGLSGIVNYGNTCYINSAIQSLSHTLELTDFFLSKKYINKLNKEENVNNELTHQWYRLLNGLWEDNCTISPKSFFKILVKICQEKDINLGFSINMQNDIQEFLIMLLDIMHNSLSENKKISCRSEKKIEKLSHNSWEQFFKNDYFKRNKHRQKQTQYSQL